MDPLTSVVENVVGLHHPWNLCPKEIERLLCICTVAYRLLLMMMMFSDRKIRV